jgi:DNA-binding MurR/RpiR family transcriptional regulator
LLPTLSTKRQRLARAILDEPFTVAFTTAEELGGQLGLDRSTVVRFSRAVGYEGFSELRDAIRSDFPPFLTATEKLRRRLEQPGGRPTSAESVMVQDIRNIQAAAAMNDGRVIDDVARAIAGSERVVVLGSGMSGPVVQTLALLLEINGVHATYKVDEVNAAAEVAALDPSSAVVGIGFWRFVPTTVRLFELAAERTPAAIAITDSQSSPMARAAAYTLIAPSDATAINNSLAAAISIVNVIVTAVATLRSDRAYEHSRAVDDVYAAAGITMP